MDLETWNWVFKITAVIAAAITFVVGTGALFTERALGQRQTAQMLALQTELSDAKARQAGAERDLLVLQERAKPRTLSTAARSAVLENLRSHVPEGPLMIEFIGGSTTEPGSLADAIAATLREAGWTVTLEGGPALGTPPTGIAILVSDTVPTPPRAAVLKAALDAASLQPLLKRSSRGDLKPGDVTLLIGLKP